MGMGVGVGVACGRAVVVCRKAARERKSWSCIVLDGYDVVNCYLYVEENRSYL